MKTYMLFTILGCGSSAGVPRPNGDWGDCDPHNIKNRRSRSALLVEKISSQGKTSIIIDTGADFRNQCLSAGVNHIDAVVYTHAHADHIHGIDDLRSFVLAQKKRIPVYADKICRERLNSGFGYCFKTPDGSDYPPILIIREIIPDTPFTITGNGGSVCFDPFYQQHGDGHSLGFRIGNMAYATDVSFLPEKSLLKMKKLDVLVLGALQYVPHPSHFSLQQALEIIEGLQVKKAILTHMHIAMDYDKVQQKTPRNVEPAYDGLQFSMKC